MEVDGTMAKDENPHEQRKDEVTAVDCKPS